MIRSFASSPRKIANRKRGEDRRTEEEKKLEGEGVRKGEKGSGNQILTAKI